MTANLHKNIFCLDLQSYYNQKEDSIMRSLIAFLTVALLATAQHDQDRPKEEGLLEVTASKNFNYGLVFLPVGKGVAIDTQYYWTNHGGSQLLTGITKTIKFRGIKLIPGAYYVSETCHGGPKPWGCNDAAVGSGWEWENYSWISRGFIAQTLLNRELRFGLADPVQVGRRFMNDAEFGFAFVGEEEREEEKYRLFGRGGVYGRKHFGKSYAEVTFLTGHGGPTMRFTVGRSFKGFGR